MHSKIFSLFLISISLSMLVSVHYTENFTEDLKETNNTFKSADETLPDLIKYSFYPEESKVLPGKSQERPEPAKINEEDKIGNLAIVSLWYQNSCYTDGRFNNNDYQITQGSVSDEKRKYNFDAYKISEPAKKATQFLASQHCIYFKFPKKTDYAIYMLQGSKIEKVTVVQAKDINLNGYTKIDKLKISKIEGSKVFFVAPNNQEISIFTKLAPNIEGARIKKTVTGDVLMYRYQMDKTPFGSKIDYHRNTRQYFILKSKTDKLCIVWQDKKDKSIHLSSFAKDLKYQKTITLLKSSNEKLIAATNDRTGNFYFLTIMKMSGTNPDKAILYKVNSAGTQLNKKVLDSSKSALNIWRFSGYMADLEFMNGKLGLIIGRTMFKSGDGLNHQGGTACIYNANDLSVVKLIGQTSSHSFDNILSQNSDNQFLCVDLGDNYPRGIHLHKFDDKIRRSRVIYTFKTAHGTSPGYTSSMNYPAYPEISTSTKKYYKWSNDNNTYSELGGVIETDDGYIIIFGGEPNSEGKSIDNTKVGENNTDPQNVGFIKIRKDFENASGRGNVASDDLVLSKGVTEIGGFYTFGGSWSEQRNAGVVWLTKYKNKENENATHIKTIKLNNGNILILWDKTGKEGYIEKRISTNAMIIDKNGKITKTPFDLGEHVVLNRRDEIINIDNKVYIAQGNGVEKKLELIVIDLK